MKKSNNIISDWLDKYGDPEIDKKVEEELERMTNKDMDKTKNVAEFSLEKMEQLTERYIDAEKFIMDLNWFERLFCSRKITKFLKSRSDKYNF
jgi:hypothetical protein